MYHHEYNGFDYCFFFFFILLIAVFNFTFVLMGLFYFILFYFTKNTTTKKMHLTEYNSFIMATFKFKVLFVKFIATAAVLVDNEMHL